MDFLDPKKQRRHAILLYAGYFLIGVAITIATIVLVYQANGYGVNSKGQVTQNGLVFFSSTPNPADIYLNGSLANPGQTNTRLSLPAGPYDVRISRAGYTDWRRQIGVQGGDVQNFDYPFLFPTTLTTRQQTALNAAPGIATQSRDRRWLMVQNAPQASTFTVYDLDDPQTPSTTLSLPAGIVTTSGSQGWELVQWADDNEHVLFKHALTSGSEYIMVDRTDAAQSFNVNRTLNTAPTELTLIDNKFDQFHVLGKDATLSSASVDRPTLVTIVQNVIAYKSYGDRTVLFATSQGTPDGKVNISMRVNDKSTVLRSVAAGADAYLMDMAGYRGTPYVVLGASNENTVYIYKDPIDQLRDDSVATPVAARALRVSGVNYVSFSPGAQYIVAEASGQFGVYDLFLKGAHVYTKTLPLDAPQTHARWMDGNRLSYVSDGKLHVFDYDNRNARTLMNATPAIDDDAFFAPNYQYVYALTVAGDGKPQLTRTALRTAADL